MDKTKAAAAGMILLLSSNVACAEDLLKPMIDSFFSAMQQLWDAIVGFVYELFPGLQDSFSGDLLGPIANFLPWIRDFYWLFYVALFFALMAVVAKIWSLGKHFIINTIVGVLLLLILIHVLGVEIKITLLNLVITAIFGVPGVIFILILHYLGIPL